MSTALWYYCNEQGEASEAIPVVQRLRNAVQDDLKTSVVRSEPKLVVGVEEDDELAVGRGTYVLAAVLNATPDATSVVVEKVEIKKASTEPVKIAAKPDVAEEPVEEVTQTPSEEETTDVVEENVEEPVVVHEEPVKTEETVAVVETVKEAVEIVAVVEEDILDSVVAQAATEEGIEQPVSEPVELEETAKESTKDEALLEAPTVQSDSPVVDKAEDVMLDVDPEPRKLVTRMPSIPEDTASVHDEIPENEDVIEEEQEEPEPVKPIADYESETETQSEVSEAPAIEAVEAVEPVAIAKSEDEPESEIEETMVIDPVVAAKEAAAVEKQTSAFSFIPEQIRNNSYAVSSVAVAVTTAIVATLVARR